MEENTEKKKKGRIIAILAVVVLIVVVTGAVVWQRISIMPQLADVTISYDPETPTIVTVTFEFTGEQLEGLKVVGEAINLVHGPGRVTLQEDIEVIDKGDGVYEVTIELLDEDGALNVAFGRTVYITLQNRWGISTEGGVGVHIVSEEGAPEITWISCSDRGNWTWPNPPIPRRWRWL